MRFLHNLGTRVDGVAFGKTTTHCLKGVRGTLGSAATISVNDESIQEVRSPTCIMRERYIVRSVSERIVDAKQVRDMLDIQKVQAPSQSDGRLQNGRLATLSSAR